jgi:hypothetical protein
MLPLWVATSNENGALSFVSCARGCARPDNVVTTVCRDVPVEKDTPLMVIGDASVTSPVSVETTAFADTPFTVTVTRLLAGLKDTATVVGPPSPEPQVEQSPTI